MVPERPGTGTGETLLARALGKRTIACRLRVIGSDLRLKLTP